MGIVAFWWTFFSPFRVRRKRDYMNHGSLSCSYGNIYNIVIYSLSDPNSHQLAANNAIRLLE